MHSDYRKAPLVVQRFGDIRKLAEQTLDPMVSACFNKIAPKPPLIEPLQERSDIQEQAGQEMRNKFGAYNLELQEVLIGTPRAMGGNDLIEKVLQPLRERQVAEERVTTYEKQRIAAAGETALRENGGKAALPMAIQQAEQTRTLARAESDRVKLTGEGKASGGAHNQHTRQIVERLAEALEKSGVDIVPRIQIGTGGDGAGGGPRAALIGMMLAQKGEELLIEAAKGDGLRPGAGRRAAHSRPA